MADRPAALETVACALCGSAAADLELEAYHPYHAVRADLLGRLGREDEARDAYETAMALTDNEAERDSLRHQRERIGAAAPGTSQGRTRVIPDGRGGARGPSS